MVVPGRVELPTSTLSVWRSNQLSYRTPPTADRHDGGLRLHIIERQGTGATHGTGGRSAPERRCSSRTFRYGYLVTVFTAPWLMRDY